MALEHEAGAQARGSHHIHGRGLATLFSASSPCIHTLILLAQTPPNPLFPGPLTKPLVNLQMTQQVHSWALRQTPPAKGTEMPVQVCSSRPRSRCVKLETTCMSAQRTHSITVRGETESRQTERCAHRERSRVCEKKKNQGLERHIQQSKI